jgi:hypothetical protein
MHDDQRIGPQYLPGRSTPENADRNGAGFRAWADRTRAGLRQDGMPAASDVVVRSLAGEVLRVESAQVDEAWQPLREPDPLPEVEPSNPLREVETDGPGYPFGPLMAVARSRATGDYDHLRLAQDVDVAHATVLKWSSRGRIPWDAADRAAVALGLLPFLIWPEFIDDGLDLADEYDRDPTARRRDGDRRVSRGWRRAEPPPAKGEDTPELARRRAQAASRNAAQREQDRISGLERMRARRADPEKAAHDLEQRRRRKAENREAANATQAAYREREEVREKNRERSRLYYAENRERLLAAQSERDKAKAAAKRARAEREGGT